MTDPGIALQTLLHNAKVPALKELVGEEVLSVLQELDPNFVTKNSIGNLAAKLIDPATVLSNELTRKKIVRMLPLPKARELAQRLGIKDGRTLYDDLCLNVTSSSCLEVLHSFFGVVQSPLDTIDTPSGRVQIAANYSLFDHQRTAASRVEDAISDAPRKVLLHMPTGSGKTRTAMHIIANHLRQNDPTMVCWLAQSAELLEQAAREFETAWSHLGNRKVDLIRFWGRGRQDLLDVQDGILVAGLSKMSSFNNKNPAMTLRLADRISLTIIDEAHQAIAPTYASVLTTLHSKRPRNALLGLTATPGRSWSDIDEDRKLAGYFDNRKVMLEIEGYNDPITFLISEKYLAQPVFSYLESDAEIKITDSDIVELTTAVDVPERILNRLGTDTQRNIKVLLAIENILNRHHRIIVFAPTVENAHTLATVLSFRGHEAFIVTSESKAADRERAIRRFKSNDERPMVIVNYGVLTTGFDVPAISAAVIARPTRSLVLYSQMIGRATRGTSVGGNERAEIVTIIDPHLPGFGNMVDAFKNWEDVWNTLP